ncbi:hypothetical protein JHN55_05305 [Streptomyces sp. MBT56]|uniref:hypothetical protein n=1 Tax=unclassified Streptomyces TaxID=2593676 RepID=UPI00190CC23D|nr:MULTISPECIES: hypothetical protein [unclassified Streptomyces]MBK3555964.1 hypothetical protein [Streptomyces sp. MBT56]MBK3605780.1 hypothetical protein [Streptomyces sp. MBT54]MBK3618304.1 hypothetical protein [Streptomyces sp. MBT98]
MHDTQDFLSQLGSQTEALRKDIEAARRDRDEAATRLATLEMRLADNTALMRAMRAYTGGDDSADSQAVGDGAATGGESDRRMSIEECILYVLRGDSGLLPLEIMHKAQKLGVTRSASSIRARLSKLHREGTVVRDAESRYRLATAGSGATRGN